MPKWNVAVRLYEDMYFRLIYMPTSESVEGIEEMLNLAREVEATVREDDRKVASLTKEFSVTSLTSWA